MKKIVGILAAAALIATSVFAADVSAQVRIAGEIFAYDGTALNTDKDGKTSPAGSFKMLRAATQSQPYWTPYITLSTSTDEAGAEVKFITGGDGTTDVSIDRSNVWFKPLDMLTIKAGFQGYNMNQEDIDWTNPTGAEDWGYAVSYAQDAISVNVFAITGNNGWFFQDAVSAFGTDVEPYNYALLKDIYVNGAYTADFGTISAMFEFKGKGGEMEAATASGWKINDAASEKTEGGQAHWTATAASEASFKSFNPQTIRFGAGYKNTIDNLTFWADVVGTSRAAVSDKELAGIKNGFAAWQKANPGKGEADYAKAVGVSTNKEEKSKAMFGVMFDAYVKYVMDALTLRGYVKADIYDFSNAYTNKDNKYTESLTANNNFSLTLKARVDYKLDNGINLFAYFGNDNLLRKERKSDATTAGWDGATSVFVSTIKAGANGSVGILDWETFLQFDTGANATLPDGKTAKEAKDYNKWDKVKVSMPVTLTVKF